MTGPRPKSPRVAKRRRGARASLPWLMIALLFGLYLVIGLVLSTPAPPIWVWAPAAIALPLMVLGLHRPLQESPKSRAPLMVYPGALLLVIALAIALNFIGNEEVLATIGFFEAILWLAGLTIAAMFLTAAAAVIAMLTGTRLMETVSYAQSRNIVLATGFLGMCIGGVAGFAMIVASRGA